MLLSRTNPWLNHKDLNVSNHLVPSNFRSATLRFTTDITLFMFPGLEANFRCSQHTMLIGCPLLSGTNPSRFNHSALDGIHHVI